MSTTVTFTANDTWIVPAGVTAIMIECWSGGSGGANKDPGNGGIGGCYARDNYAAVTPGESLTVLVGAGSVPGGGFGGASSVQRTGEEFFLCKAFMGVSGSIGDVKYDGGNFGLAGGGAGGGGGSSAGTSGPGNAGSAGAAGIGGAGGVAPVGGWAGGRGGDDGANGSDAPSYAAAGGGAGDGNGGYGGNGIVKITYEVTETPAESTVVGNQGKVNITGASRVIVGGNVVFP